MAFSGTSLVQLLNETKVREVVGEYREVLTANFFESVAAALQKMSCEKTTSAVVVDEETGKCVGIIDTSDILMHALNTHTLVQQSIPWETIEKIYLEGKLFKDERVASVHNRLKPTVKVSVDDHLFDVMAKLVDSPRALVADSEGKLVNIVAQSDIALFLTKHNLQLRTVMELTVQQMARHFSFGLKPVVRINGDTGTVLDAIQLIYDHKISGIAVVDSMDRLVGNFSSSDIKLLLDSNFRILSQPVRKFLQFNTKKTPIACYLTTSLESIILRMALEKVHRMYIVNENRCLLGIVSLSDIVRACAQELPVQTSTAL